MSIFFQLPMDLRERWWSAITWDERQAVEAEFQTNQVKLTIDQMVADFAGSRKEGDFALFAQECYTQDERNEVMESMMSCRCCSRHQQHADARPEPVGDVMEEKGCKCKCRHYARLFNRKNLA